MTFRIRKYKQSEAFNPLGNFVHRYRGEGRCILRDLNGRVVRDTGWFPNLVTNRGFYNIVNPVGVGTYWDTVHVGSSNQAPAFTDTALVSHLGYQSQALGVSQETNAGSPNYEYSDVKGARFNAGNATGTIREMGITYSSANTNMTVRTLVTPEITKNVDQVLDVYHRLTIYPDLTIRTGQITIAGELYDWEMRPLNMTDADRAHHEVTQSTFAVGGYSGGTFGGIEDSAPTGTPATATGGTNSIVAQSSNFTGTETFDMRREFGLDQFNGTHDYITFLMAWNNTTSGRGSKWQFSLDKVSDGTGLVKNNTQILHFDARYTCTRYP